MRTSEDRSFLILLAAISIAFAWVLWPFFGALLWAILLAIIFAPLYRRALETLPGRDNVAALFTVVVVIVMVLIPVAIVIASLIDQGGELYQRVQNGEISFAHPLQQLRSALPDWAGFHFGSPGQYRSFGPEGAPVGTGRSGRTTDRRTCAQHRSVDAGVRRELARDALPAVFPAARR
ncbi:AI-2E family transporter [Bradyrhizobium sp. USDA 327]|uniref:AI-2E family transporter n=1 Tax=Bradyrhizobium sp. USDA 327 TaxID=3156308 RepID=UPI003512D3D1